jgi:transposase InsO family protein
VLSKGEGGRGACRLVKHVSWNGRPQFEAFNGTLRREGLSLHWVLNLADLQQTLESWRDDYNRHCPHSSLADVPPGRRSIYPGP